MDSQMDKTELIKYLNVLEVLDVAQIYNTLAKEYINHKTDCYDMKEYCLSNALEMIKEYSIDMNYGTGLDLNSPLPTVLYFDLVFTEKQISYHSRVTTKRYSGDWDGSNNTRNRIKGEIKQVLRYIQL